MERAGTSSSGLIHRRHRRVRRSHSRSSLDLTPIANLITLIVPVASMLALCRTSGKKGGMSSMAGSPDVPNPMRVSELIRKALDITIPGSVSHSRLTTALLLVNDLRGMVSGERRTWPSKDFLAQAIKETL